MVIDSKEMVDGKLVIKATLNSGKKVTTINGRVQHYAKD